MFMSLCGDVTMMSSAYFVGLTGDCSLGLSYAYLLNNVGDRTPPCETPVLNWRCVDLLCLNVAYTLRPLM